MTMTETLKIIEESLYCSNPLPFEAMMNCYAAIKVYLDDRLKEDERDKKREKQNKLIVEVCDELLEYRKLLEHIGQPEEAERIWSIYVEFLNEILNYNN